MRREISLYATRRTQPVRKKKPGRYGRNDGLLVMAFESNC